MSVRFLKHENYTKLAFLEDFSMFANQHQNEASYKWEDKQFQSQIVLRSFPCML